MTCLRLRAVSILILLTVSLPGVAAIRLGPPFGEHMVLPRGVPVPIWGTGAPGGDTVRISFAAQSITAKSDWEGRWMAVLAPMKAGGPYQMLIEVGGLGPVVPSSAANARGGAELNDVVVGEVRVLPRTTSINPVRGTTGDASVPSAWIRVCKAPSGSQGDTQRWTVAQPGTAGSVFGPSYAFASELYRKLRVPIGVIESPGP